MSEETRKVQLGVTVDATGAKQGFDQVKQDAQSMAQAVGQAGQVAGKGIDAIGDGAKRAADGMNREEGRMRAAIQRVTLDLKTLGKSASEKLEAKIELQGLDAAKFAPYLAALKQAEEAQRRVQESAAAAGASIQRAGMTWNEFTGQRMGPVMKQFADQGLPHTEAHTAAIRQIAAEWQQYKTAGVAAQTAVATQTASTTAALAAESNALSRVTTSLGATSFANLDKVGTSLGAAAAKADEATASVHRLQREIELTGQLAGARTSFGAAVGPAVPASSLREAIERRGLPALDPRLAGGAAAAAAAAQVDALGKSGAKSLDNMGMSAKQLAFAIRGVPAQFTDIAVSLASGQRPMMVLLQQGGQLKDMFGGIGPAARALGGYVAGMVNPFTVTAAAAGVLAFAMYRAESAARGLNTLQAQLAGTGRSNLFSTDELKDFLKELQLAPGVSREVATSIVSELSKARDIGGGMLKDLGRLAVDYAKITGTDIPTANKALLKAFEDPEKGIKQLDEALNGRFSSGLILTIERLSKSGELAKAQGAQFAALSALIRGTADNFATPLQRSFNDLGNSWEGAMRKMDQSDGLRNLNALLGKTVAAVTWLIDHGDGLNALARPALAIASLGGSEVARAMLTGQPAQTGAATGSWEPSPGAAAAAAAGGASAEIKRAVEAAKAHRGQAGELEDLTLARQRYNKALAASILIDKEQGKTSEDTLRLRQAIAGVDERIASIGKRGGNEAGQVALARAAGDEKRIQSLLDGRKQAFAYAERFLQGAYQAGELSLAEYFDRRRDTIATGVQAEIAALEEKRARYVALLKDPAIKDPSQREQIKNKIDEVTDQETKVRAAAAQAAVLANKEAAASFKQLDEQVLQYQASLKSLQGDEIGASRIRDEIARRQLAVLADQSAGSSNPITQQDQAAFAAAQRQVSAVNAAKTKTSQINELLAQGEERIALAQKLGAIGELEALSQVGAARAKIVPQLEQQVRELERVAKENPLNIELALDASKWRLQLDKFKADLDPLKEKFDNLFKGSGTSALSDLLNGKTGPLGALKAFATSIQTEINNTLSKQAMDKLFGEKGAFSGAGGFLASALGGKDAAAAASTAAMSAAETAAAAAIGAASASSAASLASLTAAAQAAAAALSSAAAAAGGKGVAGLGSLLGTGGTFTGTTGLEGLSPDILAGFWGDKGGYTGDRAVDQIAGVVHGKEYVFSAPAVAAIGVDRLERLHRKAKSGHVDEDAPGYSDGGYVAVLSASRPQTSQRSDQTSKDGGRGSTVNINVSVAMPPGGSRQTAQQFGKDVAREIAISHRRNG